MAHKQAGKKSNIVTAANIADDPLEQPVAPPAIPPSDTVAAHDDTVAAPHGTTDATCYRVLLEIPRWHKVIIFMALLYKLLLLPRSLQTDLVVKSPVPPNSGRGLFQTSWCNVRLLNWLPSWPNFGYN